VLAVSARSPALRGQKKGAKRAVAKRRLRKTLQTTGRSLKTVGKAVAVAGLTAAAAATVSEIARRRR